MIISNNRLSIVQLMNNLESIIDSAKDGELFRVSNFSIKNVQLPNGYRFSFSIKQGVSPNEAHEWSEPKASHSITGRKIRRCIHCRTAYSKRITENRCVVRCDRVEGDQ